MKAKM